MVDPPIESELQQALETVRQYLSDAIAPLMAAEAVSLLLRRPAQLLATEICKWTSGQLRGKGAGVPVADYLFHALQKLHETGRLKLVDEGPLAAHLREVGRQISEFCPPEDREQLADNLGRLDQAEASLTPLVTFIHRPASRAAADPTTGEDGIEDLANLRSVNRRLSILWKRLEEDSRQHAPAAPAWNGPREELVSQVVAEAASKARSGQEFRSLQENLKSLGIESGTDQIFRALGSTLPGWALPVKPEGETAGTSLPENPTIEAMRQIIRLSENSWEVGQRFRNLVHAAVDQFNTGSLARAATMLDLANSLAIESDLRTSAVDDIRRTAHESLDASRLRSFAESREKHHLLRNVLNFFDELKPDGLLNSLRKEPKRDRRRLILSLLEAHGELARGIVIERLRSLPLDAAREEWFFPRNLIVLLHRIPRPDDAPLDAEIEMMISYSDPQLPAPLVREAITNLGQIKHTTAEHHLIEIAGKLEGLVAAAPRAGEDPTRLASLLDRSILALARYGTPDTCRRVVDHALGRNADEADLARISYLSTQDISADEDSLARVLAALKRKIPRKIFGAVIQKNAPALLSLIRSLSSTPKTTVRQVLEGVAKRFPEEEFGRAAARVLEEFSARDRDSKTPTEKLAGDLDLFGLPDLLQQFARLRLSGMLTVKNDCEVKVGTVSLFEGRLQSCSVGSLQGEEGLYQLLEKPVARTFVFLGRRDRQKYEKTDVSSLPELMPVVYEGMRRHAEFQRARAVVPDSAPLKPTGVEPVPLPAKDDPDLFNHVWKMATSGATPEECDTDCAADSFRVRSLLVRWVEEGILTLG